MIWKTVSQKFRCLTSRNLTRKEENHLLLVRVLKKNALEQKSSSAHRSLALVALWCPGGLIALQRTNLIQKYNKQMANSTVSRSNGGIKMNHSLPDGSCFDRCLTQVSVFPKQCPSVPVYRQPLPFYEYLHHHTVYYT